MKKKNILITRPGEQGETLAEQCRALNYSVTLLPMLKITPLFVDPLVVTANKKNIDIVIFISPNAIKYGLATVKKQINYQHLAVVGKSSLALLTKNNMACNIYPKSLFTSEGLLNHQLLQHVVGKNVLIVRGGAGREKLKNTLENRGAKVDYLDVYQRTAINYSQQQIKPIYQAAFDIVQVSNQQTLDGLMPYVKQSSWFNKSHWWLLSERTKKICIQYGIKETMCHIIKPGNKAFIKNL